MTKDARSHETDSITVAEDFLPLNQSITLQVLQRLVTHCSIGLSRVIYRWLQEGVRSRVLDLLFTNTIEIFLRCSAEHFVDEFVSHTLFTLSLRAEQGPGILFINIQSTFEVLD